MNDKSSTATGVPAPRAARLLKAGALASLAVAGLLAAGAAQARSDVSFSLGIGVPGVSVGVTNAPPVYYAPPVYVQPRPVYVQPAPVYYAPAPVYVRPAPVYYGPPAYYGPPGHWRHGHGRGHWR